MGIYDLQKVIDGYRSGKLDEVIEDFDQNDLAYLLKELNGFLEKNETQEDYGSLAAILEKKIANLEP